MRRCKPIDGAGLLWLLSTSSRDKNAVWRVKGRKQGDQYFKCG